MKTFVKIVLFWVLAFPVFSQHILKQALQGEWVKDGITLADGSAIFDESITRSGYSLDFGTSAVVATLNGASSEMNYSISADSILSFRGMHYKIARLEKPFLELRQVRTDDAVEPLLISMVYKSVNDLKASPESYQAKNGELVYSYLPDVVEPKFMHANSSAMDFIFSHFNFPEYKKGGFVVRFVVTQAGKLQGLRILASSDPKYDNQLIEAVKKTEGRWKSAIYRGETVNCEMEFNYDLGWNKPDNTQEKAATAKQQAEEYLENGRYYYSLRNYKNALFYFDKAIENDPYAVNAYFLRAAIYVQNKEFKKACADYTQLQILGQAKAEGLFSKYCTNANKN